MIVKCIQIIISNLHTCLYQFQNSISFIFIIKTRNEHYLYDNNKRTSRRRLNEYLCNVFHAFYCLQHEEIAKKISDSEVHICNSYFEFSKIKVYGRTTDRVQHTLVCLNLQKHFYYLRTGSTSAFLVSLSRTRHVEGGDLLEKSENPYHVWW